MLVIEDARDELFPTTSEDREVILPARDEDVVVAVLFVVVILAAKEALLFVILLDNPSILVAALELFVFTVEFNVVIEEFKEDDAE